ncbi:hypothetical protein K493DRAFT_359058 [Basidiobolus meristosporus CBS 931.73]|uniref:Uncharacterized protein n=1 Tax=Basidiobolus meristosporus CBS 931.73 TaxID=1314790 RepID=A0A1Y1XSR9_9FUNG|nr:hypothetical protein K493DRAFT_359058 [Basidiobolus meristosporus CBS 931.73]|eukprot:ORX88778.1 hypothetical protein K493DRAFT_359058 [Basidiobolus meristosporus CBS 931.73]
MVIIVVVPNKFLDFIMVIVLSSLQLDILLVVKLVREDILLFLEQLVVTPTICSDSTAPIDPPHYQHSAMHFNNLLSFGCYALMYSTLGQAAPTSSPANRATPAPLHSYRLMVHLMVIIVVVPCSFLDFIMVIVLSSLQLDILLVVKLVREDILLFLEQLVVTPTIRSLKSHASGMIKWLQPSAQP